MCDDQDSENRKIAEVINDLWKYAGLRPIADRETDALAALVIALAYGSADDPPRSIVYRFEQGELAEIANTAGDERLDDSIVGICDAIGAKRGDESATVPLRQLTTAIRERGSRSFPYTLSFEFERNQLAEMMLRGPSGKLYDRIAFRKDGSKVPGLVEAAEESSATSGETQ